MEDLVIGIVVLTEDGRIETVNPRIIALYRGALDKLVGNNIAVLLPELPPSTTDSYMDSLEKARTWSNRRGHGQA